MAFRGQLLLLLAAPWVTPVINLVADPREGFDFALWPFIYLAVGLFTAEWTFPPSLATDRTAYRLHRARYSWQVASLFFLFWFELIANCLAPADERLSVATCLYVPYAFCAVRSAGYRQQLIAVIRAIMAAKQVDPTWAGSRGL